MANRGSTERVEATTTENIIVFFVISLKLVRILSEHVAEI